MADWWHDQFISAMEGIVLVGTALTAIGYGLKRVYNTARGVEKILESTVAAEKGRQQLADELKAHITMEEARDDRRDREFAEVFAAIREITREVRPNGGSSMKDVLNHTAERVGDIHSRVAVLEEWKRMEQAKT